MRSEPSLLIPPRHSFAPPPKGGFAAAGARDAGVMRAGMVVSGMVVWLPYRCFELTITYIIGGNGEGNLRGSAQ